MTTWIRTVLTLFVLASLALPAIAQTPPGMMPYTAVHEPQFVPASEANFLQDDDILLGVSSGKVAKAYPAGDLAQHGAVFDRVPDGPISVTWCGVCNTGLVFRADVKGRTLHFQYDRMVGANEVQKDLETGTSWQQATGEAIDGPLKGTRLTERSRNAFDLERLWAGARRTVEGHATHTGDPRAAVLVCVVAVSPGDAHLLGVHTLRSDDYAFLATRSTRPRARSTACLA